jgi:hypothetical protein
MRSGGLPQIDPMRPLKSGQAWDRRQLRSQGLRQAAIAAIWMLSVAFALRMVG